MDSSRKLAAVMFTDIVGYTALMGNDENKAFEFLRKNRQLHKPIIEQYRGRWIKELGDGLLATFDTVSDAVYAAIKIQEACHLGNEYALRVGIHQGEVVFEGEDVFGDTVNIAARIQALAPVGGIWISEAVHQNIANKPAIHTRFVKTEALKNVREPVNIYEVTLQSYGVAEVPVTDASIHKAAPPAKKRTGNKKTIFFSIAAVLLLLMLFSFGFLISGGASETTASEVAANNKEPAEKSIAVLPFVNMSSDNNQEYFSDGLSEELLNHLAQISDLKVIARTSSFAFKGRNEDVRTIGEKLGVAHLLEGSVRKDGNKIRVTAQLVRASDGAHLWSETYDRDMEDIFKLQDEIAAAVVSELRLKLLPFEVRKATVSNTEAYNLILQGNYLAGKLDKESVAKARALYEQALALDPTNAAAWASLAGAYARQGWQNYIDQYVGYEKAREAARKAIALDSTLADGYRIMGAIKMYHDFDWEGADAAFKKAQQLAPGAAGILVSRGVLAGILGRWEEAIRLTEQSLTLDPLRPIAYMDLGNHYTHAGKVEEGMVYFRKALELNPLFQRAHLYLGRAYLLKDKPEAALAEIQQEEPGIFRTFGLALAYHDLGREQEADAELRHFITNYQKDWPYLIAQLYAYRGEKEQAFEWLEKAYEEKDSWLIWLNGDPLLKNLRSDPKYAAFREKMNLPLNSKPLATTQK